MSKLFSQTWREAPAEIEVESHRLLLRAGFIRQLAAGIYTYMPLARRSLARIESIMREEIDAIGGQEVAMPVVHPADIWKESGRWNTIGPELGRLRDKAGRDMALAMTHEEVVADLTRKEVRSYRQLPQLIYHIQTKWRDDPRPRAGLIRAREFTMLDSYSLDADEEGLDRQYRAHHQAYLRIFARCGLPVIAVGADTGMMGGSLAHEYMYLTPVGEDTLVLCDRCGYSANRQVARFRKPHAPQEEPRALERVATPGATTIEQLAAFLGVPAARTAKALFMVAPDSPSTGGIGQEPRDRTVIAVVRGDMAVNETKLANALGLFELRPARAEEIEAVGAVAGYGSPRGVRDALVVVDDLVAASPNMIIGANEEGFHLINANHGRDYEASVVADIASAQEGDPCEQCAGPLRLVGGVEVGNIFKLGTRYSDAMGCTYLDRDGIARPVVMGSYGIGLGRLLACIAEEHHDGQGLRWPASVAPYQVHLVWLGAAQGAEQDEVGKTGEALYRALLEAGVEVLCDDREATPGVKFSDADLIGLPLRVTVSMRSLRSGGVELKRRDSDSPYIVGANEAVAAIRGEIGRLLIAPHTPSHPGGAPFLSAPSSSEAR